MIRLIAGVGINDSLTPVKDCPYYARWVVMIKRCYQLSHKRNVSYLGVVTVCEEWLTFSNFKAWMMQQDWEGNQLDKDLKVKGNTIYAPEFCMFIPNEVNQFLKTNAGRSVQEGMPTGVRWKKENKKYVANIRDFRTGKMRHLGYYRTPEEAGQAYTEAKKELACALAATLSNQDVAKALVSYFN